jgi:uncharacterized membrane protein
VAKETPASTYRNERLLVFMALAIIIISIIAIFAVLIAGGVGLTKAQAQEGIWPTVTLLPLVGLPIGFILIFVLIITNMRRRSRESREAMEAERQNERVSKATRAQTTRAQATVAKKVSATNKARGSTK